jgi:hypothetical protein
MRNIFKFFLCRFNLHVFNPANLLMRSKIYQGAHAKCLHCDKTVSDLWNKLEIEKV